MTDQTERRLRKAVKTLLKAYAEWSPDCIWRNEDNEQGRYMGEEDFGEIDEAVETLTAVMAQKRKKK
jgi:hypothetical protein